MAVMTRSAPTLHMLREKHAEIIQLMERYNAKNIRVFGSVARGESTPESDVDLLVTFGPGTSLFELSGLWQALQELLGYNVSLLSESGLTAQFRKAIEADLIWL